MVVDPASILVTIAAGLAVGAFSALFGVGGGVFLVPFMVFVLDIGQHAAEGTSLLVILPTAIAGVAAHRRRGFVSIRPGVLLGAGGIAGSIAGASAALALRESVLQGIFGVFVVLIGSRLVIQGIKERRSPSGA